MAEEGSVGGFSIPSNSVDLVITSPPYKKKDGYSLISSTDYLDSPVVSMAPYSGRLQATLEIVHAFWHYFYHDTCGEFPAKEGFPSCRVSIDRLDYFVIVSRFARDYQDSRVDWRGCLMRLAPGH